MLKLYHVFVLENNMKQICKPYNLQVKYTNLSKFFIAMQLPCRHRAEKKLQVAQFNLFDIFFCCAAQTKQRTLNSPISCQTIKCVVFFTGTVFQYKMMSLRSLPFFAACHMSIINIVCAHHTKS